MPTHKKNFVPTHYIQWLARSQPFGEVYFQMVKGPHVVFWILSRDLNWLCWWPTWGFEPMELFFLQIAGGITICAEHPWVRWEDYLTRITTHGGGGERWLLAYLSYWGVGILHVVLSKAQHSNTWDYVLKKMNVLCRWESFVRIEMYRAKLPIKGVP